MTSGQAHPCLGPTFFTGPGGQGTRPSCTPAVLHLGVCPQALTSPGLSSLRAPNRCRPRASRYCPQLRTVMVAVARGSTQDSQPLEGLT